MHAIFITVAIGSPLLAAAFIALSGSSLGERIAKAGIWAMACSAAAAVGALYQVVHEEPALLTLSAVPAPFTPVILVDRLAAVMMVLITGVSLVIQVYSERYMQGDAGYVKFFGLLSLLTFVLLSLVTSGNLFWLFVYWHAVTWLLKALLSFNPASLPARHAARSVLRVQGFGDAALLIAIVLIYVTFGTLDLSQLFHMLNDMPVRPSWGRDTWWEMDAITGTALVLVVTVMTKSAQFPFHVWLPGTIEAPTPVSAMLHAGIVNAGGFLVNRVAPLYGLAPTALYVLFVVGALTALIGASTMLTQPSIKRTLVYSTMGQMGYMVMECGLGAFALAIFHLCAHGLFKATLFLNSGAGIHKAREELRLPPQHAVRDATGFAFMPWITGLVITLVLPLLIVLMAHGVVNIPLFEAQGTVIFLFFAWVTSSQAIFSLYRLNAVASWEVSATMLGALAFIGLTYLWAGESFTHFLYPASGAAAAYFKAAAWSQGLFDTFVACSAVLVVGVWVVLYGKAHGVRLLLPTWLERFHTRLYVAFLNALYIEDIIRIARPERSTVRRYRENPMRERISP
ncbi:MAG TPA: proton-conducting transporter membrane subunit [Nitrospiraceae bacterium]|nr:proton-conducting transporter membrane subunit [Nitrospiraceae bacterium]